MLSVSATIKLKLFKLLALLNKQTNKKVLEGSDPWFFGLAWAHSLHVHLTPGCSLERAS